MSGNIEGKSDLTEFPPLSPEDKTSFGLLGFLKFFKARKPSESPEPENGSDNQGIGEGNWQSTSDIVEPNDSIPVPYSVDIAEGRSLTNVLKRISNIVSQKNVGLMSYKDTHLQQYWMPDSFSKECYECTQKFTTFRRRHHCRVCGQIFCSPCCNQEIPGKIMGCTGDLRVCTYCCKVVLSYLQSPDFRTEMSADLRALQEDLQIKFGNSVVKSSDDFHLSSESSCVPEREEANVSIRRKPSVGYQEERFVHGRSQSPTVLSEEERYQALQNSSSLRNLYEEIVQPRNGIALNSHRYRLRTFPNCFSGSELVDWLISQNKAGTRVQGIAIGQALLEAGYIESVGDTHFIDGLSFYRPLHIMTLNNQNSASEGQEPLWMKQIPQQDSINTTDSESEKLSEIEEESITQSNSNYLLDINVKDNVVHVSRPSPPLLDDTRANEKVQNQLVSNETVKDSLNIRKDTNDMLNTDWDKTSTYVRPTYVEEPSYKILSSAFEHHVHGLLQQLLNNEGISLSWSDVVLPIVKDIVNLVRPDMRKDTDEMDIRHYVQVKKLPAGQRNECAIISGVVCSKNVAHRLMRTRISNPRILLLRCSVVYQRNEGRLLSLEPVMMQEQEYLGHVVARIAALQPDIVMVYRNVSRLAQEYLLKLGITLILNTKLSVLERVSRFTQADIVTSVDAHISKPQLGTCQSFYLKTYETEKDCSKTLMFFEGCSNPELSCTLLLRGGTNSELKKLKHIVSFIIFACYNWRLEKSFLMDEFAKPPSPPSELFEESPDQDSSSVNYTSENKSESKIKIDKEDKKIAVEAVQDCSDPLQSYLNLSDEVTPRNSDSSPLEEFSVAELPFSNKFRKSLDETVLSVSLYIKCNIPYLETESGRNCILRRYFPKEIFYSKQFLDKSELSRLSSIDHQPCYNLEMQLKDIKLLPKHPFVTAKITDTVNSTEIQTLLALYRANGGRIPLQLTETEKRKVHENIKFEPKIQEPRQKLDVLDPANHQRLPVLFCSYSYTSQNFPAFCVDPWIVNMYFYGTYDIPLGSFLERYCFKTSYVCPSVTCNTPMLDHVRRFVHDPGCVHLTLNNLEELDSKQILMWSWCPKCRIPSPVVPMSSETWSFSFAKYLELRFRGHIYTRRDSETCKHSLHHDHYQYFGMNKVVALFKFSPVAVWEIYLPPPIISIQFDPQHKNAIMDELRNLAIKGYDIYSSVYERLSNLECSEEDIQAMEHQQQKEQAHFKSKIEEIQEKLTLPILEGKKNEGARSEKEVESVLWKIDDSVMDLRRLIAEAVVGWNARFQDAVNLAKKKDDKEKEKQKRGSESVPKAVTHSITSLDDHKSLEREEMDEESVDDIVFETSPNPSSIEAEHDSEDNFCLRNNSDTFDESDRTAEDKKEKRSQSCVTSSDECQTDSKHDKKTVKNILSQILTTSNKDFFPIQSPWNSQEHYLLPPGPNAYVMVHENEPSSIIAYALASHDYHRHMEELQHKKLALSVTTEAPTPSPVNRRKTLTSMTGSDKDVENPDGRRTTVLSLLRGSNVQGGSQNSVNKTPENSQYVVPNSGNTSDNTNVNNAEVEEKCDESSKKPSKILSLQHIEIIFSDSTTNFYCRIYFAEQFAKLRQAVFPVGEEAFVRSLARCVQWAARGGKSGSTFCKTKDDRYVLKEMSKLELQLFLEFATHYFSYIQKCREKCEPTLLGKIVGVYMVSFRNSSSNSAMKSNLLIMENLFYKRDIVQKYDLKGSVRNRLVNPTLQNEGEVVYLDENLLKMTTDSPLYILPHSQAVLMRAIESDTQFLASQTVMDYSLLVGLDENKRELVVGIIDYIRTFTWDKKLETIVKKSGIMGGQGKQPTIIQPKEYRERFIAAMNRYFLPVPDRWSGLGKVVDS
ncbi:UNVERIFIED_CONTAM: hypothetical protein PYX00_008735 [Menopon gallinae]